MTDDYAQPLFGCPRGLFHSKNYIKGIKFPQMTEIKKKMFSDI